MKTTDPYGVDQSGPNTGPPPYWAGSSIPLAPQTTDCGVKIGAARTSPVSVASLTAASKSDHSPSDWISGETYAVEPKLSTIVPAGGGMASVLSTAR